MSLCTETAAEAQGRRVRLKQQGQLLCRLVVEGTNLSQWEARILLEAIEEVYFREAKDRPLRDGEVRFSCAQASAPAGKPLKECKLCQVVLPVYCLEEDCEVQRDQNDTALRRQRIVRLTESAREQGGYLTQEDLATLLMCEVRTIRRDIKYLREHDNVIVATRGQQKDIGPGVTHRGLALRLWLEGKDTLEVSRHIKHSLKAVERYVHTFARCVYCRRKGFTGLEIALTVGISTASVETYLGIYEEVHNKPDCAHRWEELDIIGAAHYQDRDAKKGIPTSPTSLLNGRKTP